MNNDQVTWFVAGLIVLILLASYVPKLAGGFIILLVTVLALRAAEKNLL